ncbi:hypothetical protein [Cellulosilyticum sp. WCF-2]|uniref:hypothetical protein n=1 Tax=Cellulosilyticum sp. WCF-2 TaxID=2497860 RepID=UPI000F8C4CD3|nr:hypothetical protein [Cellulosilyticum sp. WCF-2]QEH69625.1 hypothetical protein EKH84_14985 [Cellulosilyticum sp. WCF-2]
MNKRLRTLIFVIIALLLAGMFIIQFIMPKSSYVEEAITDTTLINELDTSAQAALKKYFDIEVSETEDWAKGAVRNRAKEDSGLENILSLTAKDESENKVEGDLEFYGIIMEEATKEIRGMIYQYVTEAPVLELTDEEVQARCEAFLKDKGLVAEDIPITVDAIQSDEKTPELKMLSMKAGNLAYAVAYNLQIDKVMYFEYVPMQE